MSGMTFLRLVIFTVLLPSACGIYMAKREHMEGGGFSLARIYVYGWILMFALFEILCVPYAVLQKHFSSFARVYEICVFVMAALSVLSFCLLIRRQKAKLCEASEEKKQEQKEKQNQEKTQGKKQDQEKKKRILRTVLWIFVIVLVAAQMLYLFFYNHMDGDDSYYIAESVLTDYYDTMFQRDAYTGMPMGLDDRHALSANPIFITWLGKMCGLHPAVMAHSILAPLLLCIMYCIYTLIGRSLLAKHENYIPVFVLFINIWYIWGNVSIYTAETFMYTRTWQGKAIFANLIIPLVFYCLYEMMKKRQKTQWIMLALLSLTGVFATTAAVYLIPLVYGIVGICLWIREKTFRPCFYLMLCCIPSLILGVVYRYLIAVWG